MSLRQRLEIQEVPRPGLSPGDHPDGAALERPGSNIDFRPGQGYPLSVNPPGGHYGMTFQMIKLLK